MPGPPNRNFSSFVRLPEFLTNEFVNTDQAKALLDQLVSLELIGRLSLKKRFRMQDICRSRQ